MFNMVRILAGSLMEVGRGRLSLERLQALIDAPGERNENPRSPRLRTASPWSR